MTDTITRSFNFQDRLGRRIGTRVTPKQSEDGTRFFFAIQNTRNGADYQSRKHSADFPTAEARDTAIEKYLRTFERSVPKIKGAVPLAARAEA